MDTENSPIRLAKRFPFVTAFWLIAVGLSVLGVASPMPAMMFFAAGAITLIYQLREYVSGARILDLWDQGLLVVQARAVSEWLEPDYAIEKFADASVFEEYLTACEQTKTKHNEVVAIRAQLAALEMRGDPHLRW